MDNGYHNVNKNKLHYYSEMIQKCLDSILQKHQEVNIALEKDNQERNEIQSGEIEKSSKNLELVNKRIAERLTMRSNYESSLHDIEICYKRIISMSAELSASAELAATTLCQTTITSPNSSVFKTQGGDMRDSKPHTSHKVSINDRTRESMSHESSLSNQQSQPHSAISKAVTSGIGLTMNKKSSNEGSVNVDDPKKKTMLHDDSDDEVREPQWSQHTVLSYTSNEDREAVEEHTGTEVSFKATDEDLEMETPLQVLEDELMDESEEEEEDNESTLTLP